MSRGLAPGGSGRGRRCRRRRGGRAACGRPGGTATTGASLPGGAPQETSSARAFRNIPNREAFVDQFSKPRSFRWRRPGRLCPAGRRSLHAWWSPPFSTGGRAVLDLAAPRRPGRLCRPPLSRRTPFLQLLQLLGCSIQFHQRRPGRLFRAPLFGKRAPVRCLVRWVRLPRFRRPCLAPFSGRGARTVQAPSLNEPAELCGT